jgi:hypothetical protein
MKTLQMRVAIAVAVACMASSPVVIAQTLTPLKRAERVLITQTPALESARDDLAIIRWSVNNPGGLDDHFGVVQYGTDPNKLDQTAMNHIRLNRAHPETMFRVRLTGLARSTTYYYRVYSVDSGGASDGVQSPILHFTTPAAGERI